MLKKGMSLTLSLVADLIVGVCFPSLPPYIYEHVFSQHF